MDNTTTEAQKTTAIKTLAIIGFVVTLIFGAWLAVQGVRLVPAAFNTLAAISSTIKNNQTPAELPFTVAADANIVNTGQPLVISWTQPSTEAGNYTFSYSCIEGVSATTPDNGTVPKMLPCDAETPITEGAQSMPVTFSSEKSHFVDVHYKVSFQVPGTDAPRTQANVITIVNPDIATHTETPITPPVSTPTTRVSPVSPTPTKPVVVAQPVVSNSLGNTDLAVSLIGIGSYNPATQQFTPQTTLAEGTRGAIQFGVKNIGTKTSSNWAFAVTLDSSPKVTYTSATNEPLKPGERQVVTVQFDTGATKSGTPLVIVITGGDDRTTANNVITTQVTISK